MATKRRKKTRRRSAPRVHKAIGVARRKRKRNTGLSSAFTPSSAKAAAKDMVNGGIGGLAAAVIEKGASVLVTGANGKIISTLLVLGGSYAAHGMLKKPAVSSGMVGALAYSWSKSIPFLNEDADYADEDSLEEESEYMDNFGNPMDANGNLLSEPSAMYLSEPSAMYLQDSDYDSQGNQY